jgi:hypothetical protein
MQYNTKNLEAYFHNGKVGPFLMMHILYHTSHLEIFRHLRHSLSSIEGVHRDVYAAQEHARTILETVQEASKLTQHIPGEFSLQCIVSPAIETAVCTAMEVVTARVEIGPDSAAIIDIATRVSGILEIMGRTWKIART